MSTQKNLITLCIATVFTLGLAACGGGGSSPVTMMDDDTTMAPDDTTMDGPMIAGKTVPSGTTVTLPAGTDAPTVTFSAVMDETITVEDIGTFTCLTAEGCSVAVAGDVITTTGDIEVVSLAVTDADILGQLVAAIAAGEAPKPVDVDLAALTAGYVIAPGTVEIPAGGTVNHGDVALTCSGDEACTVTVADDGTATSLGGTVTAANSPLYVANLEADRLEMEAADALVAVQEDAAKSATDAMTAAGNADTAATAAETARGDAATLQTRETSGDLAAMARAMADKAQAAYMTAKKASEAAATAGDITAAVRAQVDAENALADAMAAETKADEYAKMSTDAFGNELEIDDKTKTVGGTSLTINGTASSQTIDKQTVITGLMANMNPKHENDGVAGVAGDADASPNPIAYKQAVGTVGTLTDIEIGFVYDSSDDKARLMLVTSYAGTKMVRVYNAGVTMERGTKAGYITIEDDATTDVTDVDNVRLRSAGTYYPAGIASGDEGALSYDDEVAAAAKGKEVFSYVDVGDGNAKKYVVLTTDSTTDGTTTYTYTNVDVTADHDGDTDQADATPETGVMAGLPEKTAYDHIHFGVWAALAAAAKDGTHGIDSLGIGFVQSIGDGMTGADMPNHGTATYNGDWAATVQASDPDGNGGITLQHGAASMEANFGMGKVTATLADLAVLEGDIAGSAFEGTEASVHDTDTAIDNIQNDSGLNTSADAKFTGSFSGAFYGAKAAEAGGVFDFESEGNEDGAFRGAFGGGS